MYDAIFSWLLLIGMIMGLLCLLNLIGNLLTPHLPRIEVHFHPVRTVRELKHTIERDGETYIFEETEDCLTTNEGIQ
jgi:hypothetical protein